MHNPPRHWQLENVSKSSTLSLDAKTSQKVLHLSTKPWESWHRTRGFGQWNKHQRWQQQLSNFSWRPLTTPDNPDDPCDPWRTPTTPVPRRPLHPTTPYDPWRPPDDPWRPPDHRVYDCHRRSLSVLTPLGNFNNLPHIFCWAYCFVRSKGLNHVKSITMTHMLNLLLCRVEGDKFQKWLKMPMFFTCSTYWLAVGEGINEYKNDYISFCYIIYST